MPTDTTPGKIIVSIHLYAPYEFALAPGDRGKDEWSRTNPGDTNPIAEPLSYAYEKFVGAGIPVIIGEFGAMNRGNEDARDEWAEYYAGYAKSKGIPCFWWDNAISGEPTLESWGWTETFGILDRDTSQFAAPGIVDALMRATE
jgi:endoglucanase